jgi:hypothetical protein
VVEEAAIPFPPRKLHRSDWRAISRLLSRYYDDLVKMFEPETAEFFDRVMQTERARRSN